LKILKRNRNFFGQILCQI